MHGMSTAPTGWIRERGTAEMGRGNCKAARNVISLPFFVHFFFRVAQQLAPCVKLLLHRELLCDALEQILTQHRFGNHLLVQVVDEVQFYVTLRGSRGFLGRSQTIILSSGCALSSVCARLRAGRSPRFFPSRRPAELLRRSRGYHFASFPSRTYPVRANFCSCVVFSLAILLAARFAFLRLVS